MVRYTMFSSPAVHALHLRASAHRLPTSYAAIDQYVGLANIPGEVYAYLSAPAEPQAVDEVFAAGIDRVAYDLNIWDEQNPRRGMPGACASHWPSGAIARATNTSPSAMARNKACSAFVVGLEPARKPAGRCRVPGQPGHRARCYPCGCPARTQSAACSSLPVWIIIARYARHSRISIRNISTDPTRRDVPARMSPCAETSTIISTTCFKSPKATRYDSSRHTETNRLPGYNAFSQPQKHCEHEYRDPVRIDGR